MSIKQNKKGSAKAKLHRTLQAERSSAGPRKLSNNFLGFPHGKKGIEMTMQLIVVVIILIALLVFMLVFLTGQGGRVTGLWENITIGAVNQPAG